MGCTFFKDLKPNTLIKKLLFIIWFIGLSLITIAQKSNNAKYETNFHILDSVFPIDNIKAITITNLNGVYTLTSNELTKLKIQLKKSKFISSRLVKPSRIILKLTLKNNSIIKAGDVYGKTGVLHFQNAIDKFGKVFNATVYLPIKLNFDNYK